MLEQFRRVLDDREQENEACRVRTLAALENNFRHASVRLHNERAQ